MNKKNYNRQNIEEIIKDKISNLPILLNDTNNVISLIILLRIISKEKKKFWDLIKN